MLFAIFILWVIFNGRVTLETILLGVAVSAALFLFACKFLGYSPKTEVKVARFFARGVRYAGILIYETAKANVYVSKIVYSRKIDIKPQMVFFKTGLKTTAARVMLANSITLTPGTLTIVLNDDLLCVHCLNSDLAGDIDKSVFVKQLERFEKG
jgi:multicomponent Na+:H+ antiporter subunit E